MKIFKEMTEEEMLVEYLKEYPQAEIGSDCLFKCYSSRNGIKIKGKKTKSLDCYYINDSLDSLYIEQQHNCLWDKLSKSIYPIIYLWGGSILIDFNEDFYYEIGLEQNIIDFFVSNPNKKLSINKLNINKDKVDKEYKFDIIIL